MNRTKLVFGFLLVLTLGAVPPGAFGQAAAEAGLVSGLSSASTTSAASRLSAATNRALEGHTIAAGKISRPATSTVVHRTRPAGSKVSTGSTTSVHRGVATATSPGAKLPDGIAHVWPEGALTQAAPQ
ncbi:MAG TPA: hypothetical protein VNY74_02235 [Edaphobacter sp.]|nr:hypothetical protein [Edaphobacter sp.]